MRVLQEIIVGQSGGKCKFVFAVKIFMDARRRWISIVLKGLGGFVDREFFDDGDVGGDHVEDAA